MAIPVVSDEDFVKLWQQHQSPKKLSDVLGVDVRNIYSRRRNLEAKHGIILKIKDSAVVERHAAKVHFEIDNGIVIVFSDAHFWDTTPTAAYRALIKFIKELKPKVVVNNGDAFDGASISKHNRIGFLENRPSVIDELKACQVMLDGIVEVAEGAKLTWPLGNHDSRFETFLAASAPQYEFVEGFHLKDHFPEWIPCWATWINGHTVIKHRWKGGLHAAHNNTVGAGTSIVTGHLHSLKVTPYTDYNGTRYGVDTGTLSRIDGDQFINYTETNPVNWRSGFAVLTFHNSKLLPPETVEVINEDEGLVCFRGQVYQV